VTGPKLPAVQRLQFFLSESVWDPDLVNERPLELLLASPLTAPHGGGVVAIDDSGDRKDGTATAHVGRQWLGRYGTTDNGVVTVATVWADERVYYPVHAVPYTPARHFGKGKADPAFHTKLQIAADSAYGDQEARPQERGHRWPDPPAPGEPDHSSRTRLAPRAASRRQLADPGGHAHALVTRMVQSAPPPDLQHLIDDVTAGHGLFLYPPP
jgi:DDE superfamily endonuclease